MEGEDVSRIEKSWWRKVFERKVNGACMRDPRVVLRRNRLRNGGLRAIWEEKKLEICGYFEENDGTPF